MPAGTLGGSYVLPAFYHTSTQTWYPPALYNQIVGYDATTSRDIKIEMNSDYSWYYGLDGNTPSTLMDFTTVLLHEVNHGLGFSDNIYYEKGNANSGCFYYIDGEIPRKTPYPNTFSRQLYQGTSGPCITELTDAQRSALITSGNLYAGRPGSKLLAANGGNRVKMYAPNPYEDGSSVCHWDWGVSFKTFMRYAFVKGESCHVIGNRELGILIDMGWTENGGGTSDCSGPTGLTVNYSKNCTSAALSWKDPVSASPKGVVFSEGFEGSIDGWTVEKNGEEEWKIYTESATIKAHGGVRFAGHLWVLNKKRDAWLYSPAFQMNAGTKYTIKFWLRLPGYPEDGEHDYFELKIGQSNTISAMTTTLYNNTTTYIPDWTLISKEFTPSTTGTYHLGFHAFTPLNQGSYILIDDIEVSTGGSNFSYNIYRDGSKIASGIKEVYYTDSGFDSNKSHKWEVKTVCSGGGESNPASVTKGCTVGIDENENQEISIYPNPTSGEIKVQSSKFKVQSVEVFDVMGKKQKSRKAEEQNVLLDISDLSNGIYFVKITTESGVVTKKIIKY